MTTDPKAIRPARGLWAAVNTAELPGREIAFWTISSKAKYARAELAGEFEGYSWPDLRARGWRIIRAMQSQETE